MPPTDPVVKPKRRYFGIRVKFILTIIAAASVGFIAMAVSLVNIETRTLRAQILAEAKSFSGLATKPIGDTYQTYHDSGQIRIRQQISRFTALNPDITQVAITDLEGKVLFKQADSALTIPKLNFHNFDPIFVKDKAGNLIQVIQPYVEDSGIFHNAVVYEISSASINKTIAQTTRVVIIVGLSAILIITIILYVFVNLWFLRPVDQLSEMALAISAGQLEQEVKLNREDEIADLAQSVNKMASSLKADISRLQQTDKLKSEFMMLISHNLRTPVSIINNYIETIKILPLDAKMQGYVKTIASASARLNVFAEDILTISSIEAGAKQSFSTEPTEIAPVLNSVAEEFKSMAEAKGLYFQSVITPTDKKLNINKAQFRGAIWNILDNALKFTDHGGITLSYEAGAQVAKVSIADTGTGIAAEELPKLFTKFHRGTNTLKYDYDGSGIGLYVTKLVVEQLGGKIDVQSQLHHGSIFTIIMPVAATPPTTTAAVLPPPNQ